MWRIDAAILRRFLMIQLAPCPRDRLPSGREAVHAALSVNSDHDLGRLYNRLGLAPDLQVEIVNGLVCDRGGYGRAADVERHVRSGRAFFNVLDRPFQTVPR